MECSLGHQINHMHIYDSQNDGTIKVVGLAFIGIAGKTYKKEEK